MVKQALLLGMVATMFACGGKKGGSTTPEPDPLAGGERTDLPNNNDPSNVVSAETMDEIQRMFQRKGPAVSRCLAFAVDNKELPKNSRGKVTLEVTITTSGSAGEIKVLKATLESKSLTECIVSKVKEIQFPAVPKSHPTTYTYAFEAM